MSRFLLLIVMVTWIGAAAAPPRPIALDLQVRMSLFAGGFALIVLIPALWARVLSRYVAIANLNRNLVRYSWGTEIARVLIPIWFAAGVFALGWVQVVERALSPIAHVPVDLPSALIGTLPAMLAWMGLWWAAYPADRALREQHLLLQLQDGLPIHAPPGFWSYFSANLRMQLLFTAVPVLLILLVRDLAAVGLWWGFRINLQAAKFGQPGATGAAQVIEWVIVPISAAAVFVFAPEILRRVLQTQPLPDSSLRRRLEEMCRRSGLRYRDILLWRTGNNVGNAAVMGVLPQVRYILLSDLLLESMTEKQIEAVFAHEAGHVVHRHMAWYAVFVVVAIVFQLMIATLLDSLNFQFLSRLPVWIRDPLMLSTAVAGFFLLFGFLSRWFERQADVYAARTVEHNRAGAGVTVAMLEASHVDESLAAPAHALPSPSAGGATLARADAARALAQTEMSAEPAKVAPVGGATSRGGNPGTYVGAEGATMFASALRRVAVINNIPVGSTYNSRARLAERLGYVREFFRHFTHGSIADRIAFLRNLSAHPRHTARFDRLMGALYCCLTFAAGISIAWVALMIWRG